MESNEHCVRNSTLKIMAAYGAALGIFQNAIIFLQFLDDRQKSDSLYDYDTLYKVWRNWMKIGRGVDF